MGVIADKIRSAIFGKDVREDIAEGIEAVESLRADYDAQVMNAGNSNAEIVDARGGDKTQPLHVRLDSVDTQLNDITTDLADIPQQTYITEKAKQADLIITNNEVTAKRDKNIKLELEDMSATALSAITGGGTVNLLTIPQDISVTERTIDESALNYMSSKFSNEHVNLYDINIETKPTTSYSTVASGTLVDGLIISKDIKFIKSVAVKMSGIDTIKIGVGYVSGGNFVVYDYANANVVAGVNIVPVNLKLDPLVDSQFVIFATKIMFASDSTKPNYGKFTTYTGGSGGNFNGTYAYTQQGNGIIFISLNDVYYNLPTFATNRNQGIGKNDFGLLQLKIDNVFVGNSVAISDFNSLKDLDFGVDSLYTNAPFPRKDIYIMNKVLEKNIVGISQVKIKSIADFSWNPNTIVGIGYMENDTFTVTDFIEKKFATNAINVIDVNWFTTPNKNNYMFVSGAFLYAVSSEGVTSWLKKTVVITKGGTFSSLTVNDSRLMVGVSLQASVETFEDEKPSNIITVGKHTSYDFTEIQAAIDSIGVTTIDNPITIKVYAGVYSRINLMGSKYINLIGEDRNLCFIKDSTGVRATPPINAQNNGIIKGFTVIATHDDITELPTHPIDQWGNANDFGSYAIHSDFGTNHLILEDCTFISYQTAAIGAGLFQDGILEIKNCDCHTLSTRIFNPSQAGDYPAILCHGQGSLATNQKIVIDNCHCWTKDCTSALWVYKGVADNEMDITIYNSTFYCESSGKTVKVDLDCLTPDSYGNNVATLNL